MNNWIRIEDGLPEINEPLMGYNDENIREVFIENHQATVLAYDPKLGVFKARLYKGNRWSEISSISVNGIVNVTHWMPLPPPPKP